MEQYVGIDVSLEQSSVCVMDRTGQILRETKVASDPDALLLFLGRLEHPVTLLGMEAGPLSQWLHAGLAAAGIEVVLMETRQVKAALSAMIAKRSPEGRRNAPVARFERRDGRRPSRPTGATRAGSRSSCGWDGSGRCTASRPRPGRCGRC